MNEIEKKTKNIISEKLNIEKEKIYNYSSFEEDLNADSLDKVDLIMAIEEKFNLEIEDDKAEKINTVQELINYIKQNICDKE